MNFQPKTKEQLNEENRLPDGEYDFEVLEAKESKSRSGNDMIELKLRVFTGNGDGFRLMTDYLLEAMAFKLIHFCEGVGLSDRYAKGTLRADDCKGCAGRCKVEWQKSKNPEFQDKNVIKDYIGEDDEAEAATASQNAEASQAPPPEDDVPF